MISPIIYYGGKSSMLDNIIPIIPKHEVYTEVFFGGGAVFFAKQKSFNETINDRLDIVVNFYKQLKQNYKSLSQMIQSTLCSRSDHDKALLIIKNKTLFSSVDVAWAFWMLCNFSYGNKIGGGLKYSNIQSTVVPKILKKKKELFTQFLVERVQECCIENREALQVLASRNIKDAFHYLDPPYPDADQGHYKGYTFNDFQKLLLWCQDTCKGKFLLSNYNSEMLNCFIEKNNWWKKEFKINNKGMRKNDIHKIEVLVANYKPLGAQEIQF